MTPSICTRLWTVFTRVRLGRFGYLFPLNRRFVTSYIVWSCPARFALQRCRRVRFTKHSVKLQPQIGPFVPIGQSNGLMFFGQIYLAIIFTTFSGYFLFIRFVVVHVSFARVECTVIVSYNIVFVFNETAIGFRAKKRRLAELIICRISLRYMRSVLFRSMRFPVENRLLFTARFGRVIMLYDSFFHRLPPVPWVYFCL